MFSSHGGFVVPRHELIECGCDVTGGETADLAVQRSGAGGRPGRDRGTALSESVAATALSRGSLTRVAFRLPNRTYLLLRHWARFRTRAGDAFVGLARAMKDVLSRDDYVI